MPKEGPASEVVPVQPHISQEKVQAYLSYKPKAETLESRKRLHQFMAQNARLEAAVHSVEMESADRTIEVALGLRSPLEESNVMSDDESHALESSMDEYKKNQSGEAVDMNDFREAFMGSLKDQENFKAHYHKWEKEYEQKCQKNPKFAEKTSLDDYVRERGVAYIKENAKLVIRRSSNEFFNSNSPKNEKLSKEELDAKRDKFYKVVDLFVRSNREALTGYSGLSPADRAALLVKFSTVLATQGFADVPKEQVQKFLEELAGHMEYQYLAILEYEGTYKEMSTMVDLGLSDEEWEQRRQLALKNNAKNELQEYLQQPQQPVYASSGFEAPTVAFSSVKDVANSSGVHLRPATGKGENVYYVDFPVIKDAKFAPLVRVVYPQGSDDINKATFVIEEPWADPDAQLGKPIDKQPTKEYKTSEVLLAMNRMLLNYVLNKRLNLVLPATSKESPNTIIRDDLMIHFAERLFGFSLSDKRILESQTLDYENFLIILMRDDKKSSLEERVKMARVALDDDGLLPYIREMLKVEGSTTKTFDELVEEAKLRRSGNEKKA